MKFFDSLIEETENLVSSHPKKSYPLSDAWKDAGANQVIMRRDTAAELDGVGFNLVTSKKINDEIVVVGDDLGNISGEHDFARIAVIEIDNTEDEQAAYKLIKKIEYVKYHCFPEGYMSRSTSRSHKEAVRVSKKAIKEGICFQSVGTLLIKKYKEIPAVRGVKLIFITNPDADLGKAEKIAAKGHEIAETLNHVMNSINFDCDTCSLKAICDEVEGMKELHFKNSAKMG